MQLPQRRLLTSYESVNVKVTIKQLLKQLFKNYILKETFITHFILQQTISNRRLLKSSELRVCWTWE